MLEVSLATPVDATVGSAIILGGTAEGELAGAVQPGSLAWTRDPLRGVLQLDARFELQTGGAAYSRGGSRHRGDSGIGLLDGCLQHDNRTHGGRRFTRGLPGVGLCGPDGCQPDPVRPTATDRAQDSLSMVKIWPDAEGAWTDPGPGGAHLKVHEFLTFHLLRLSSIAKASVAREYLDPSGLTVPEWRLLATVAVFSPLPFSDITAMTTMDKGQVSRTLRSAQAKGLVATELVPADRRTAAEAGSSIGQPRHRQHHARGARAPWQGDARGPALPGRPAQPDDGWSGACCSTSCSGCTATWLQTPGEPESVSAWSATGKLLGQLTRELHWSAWAIVAATAGLTRAGCVLIQEFAP